MTDAARIAAAAPLVRSETLMPEGFARKRPGMDVAAGEKKGIPVIPCFCIEASTICGGRPAIGI